MLLQRTAVSLVPVMAQALPEVLLLPESRGSAAVDDAVVREAAAALDSSVEVARDFLELTQELRAVVIPSMIAGVVKDKQDRATSCECQRTRVTSSRTASLNEPTLPPAPQMSPLVVLWRCFGAQFCHNSRRFSPSSSKLCQTNGQARKSWMLPTVASRC